MSVTEDLSSSSSNLPNSFKPGSNEAQEDDNQKDDDQEGDEDQEIEEPGNEPQPPSDTTPPVLELNGPAHMDIEPCEGFQDPGANFTDNEDDPRVVYADVSGINFRLQTSSPITLTYTASDEAGNAATPVTRTISIVRTGLLEQSHLVEIGNDLSGNYHLCNDIQLSGNWTPIPGVFLGSIDGQLSNGNRARISGLRIVESGNTRVGLFRSLGQEANIQNLEIFDAEIKSTGSTTSTASSAGMLAGYVSGNVRVENILYSGVVEARAQRVGGLIGEFHGGELLDIKSSRLLVRSPSSEINSTGACWTSFAGRSLKNCMGGVVGLMGNNSSLLTVRLGELDPDSGKAAQCPTTISSDEIIVCSATSSGQIHAKGGAVGLLSSHTSLIENVKVDALVFNQNGGSFSHYLGGIVGASAGPVKYSFASGRVHSVTTFTGAAVGGISGWHIGSNASAIQYSGNYSAVLSRQNVGGVVGCLGSYSTNHLCTQTGLSGSTGNRAGEIYRSYSASELIEAREYVGGLVGTFLNGLLSESFSDNFLTTTTLGSGGFVGGLVGLMDVGNTTSLRGLLRDSYQLGGSVRALNNAGGTSFRGRAGGAVGGTFGSWSSAGVQRVFSVATIIRSDDVPVLNVGGLVSWADSQPAFVGSSGSQKDSPWWKSGQNSYIEHSDNDGYVVGELGEMKLSGLYLGLGWSTDFWSFPSNQFPRLKWESSFDFPHDD